MADDADPPAATALRGADPAVVRAAIDSADPLAGTCGFAGRLDGALVRDVLGREPLFVETDGAEAGPTDEGVDTTAEEAGSTDGSTPNDSTDGPASAGPDGLPAWSHRPGDLSAPAPVPAGHRVTGSGDERVLALSSPDPIEDTDRAISLVRDRVRESVDAVDQGGLAVAFSGGVDSSILAARWDCPLYVAGFPDSHDVAAARSAADLLDADLRVVELDHDALVAAVPRVVAATGRTNAMDVAIALPLFLVAERAAADGFDRLGLGQGADELFGGYAKVAGAPDDPRVDADTVRGARREVVETLPDQLERDVLALRAAGVEPVTPLLRDGVVAAALSLDGELLATGEDDRKVALRRAAAAWLPDELADRDKKALQYGSLVSRELDRLARQAGYKRRMDDHVSKYVASLVE